MKHKNYINTLFTFLIFIVIGLYFISCDAETTPTESSDIPITPCTAKDNAELVTCIEKAMKEQNNTTTPNLNKITLDPKLTSLEDFFHLENSPLNAGTSGFDYSTFNGDISGWDTSNITDMSGLFVGNAVFNRNIGNWDTSKVTDMSAMFYGAASFNQDIGKWNTSLVINMGYMFTEAKKFNQDISQKQVPFNGKTYTAWDVSKVKDMLHMFRDANAFNQNIGNWTTTSLEKSNSMFQISTPEPPTDPTDPPIPPLPSDFNQDISGWDMSKVTTMALMFSNASSFNQDLSGWTWGANGPATAVSVTNIFANSGMAGLTAKYPPVCSNATGVTPYTGANSC